MPFSAEQRKEYDAKRWANRKDRRNAERRMRYSQGFTLENELVNYVRKHISHVDDVVSLGECPIRHFMKCKVEHVKKWLEVQFDHEMTWDNFGLAWKIHNIFSGIDMNYDSEKQAKMLNPSYLSPRRIIGSDIEELVSRAKLWNTINEDVRINELPRDYAFEDDRTNEREESIAKINEEAEGYERKKASAAKILREKDCSEEQITFILSQDRYGAIAIMNKERLHNWLSKKNE